MRKFFCHPIFLRTRMTHGHPRPRSQFPSRHNEEKLVAVIVVSSEHRNEISETLLLDLDAPWMHVKIIDDRTIFLYLRYRRLNSSRLFHQLSPACRKFPFLRARSLLHDERSYLVQALEKREGCEILKRFCL